LEGTRDQAPVEQTRRVIRQAPLWRSEFARQAAANAVGTLTAALMLLVVGVLLGAINHVPTRAVVAAITALVALVVMAVSTAMLVRLVARYVEKKRQYAAIARPFERVSEAHDLTVGDIDFERIHALIAL
jgi:hypothetical protein